MISGRSSDHFFPKKSLGQNFLINPNTVRRIIDACDLKPTDTILEIGPGKGAITHALSQYAQTVIAIEKDGQLFTQLARNFDGTNVHMIHADILKYPFDQLPDRIKIIGNLPYGIATPIIEKVIQYRRKFYEFYMTVQLEYGQRITAKPNNKNYGSFSCFVRYYTDAKILFKIKNSCFSPVPKVQSCFLRLDIRDKPEYKVKNDDDLFRIIRACFNQRRKTIQNSLSVILDKTQVSQILQRSNINPKWRAENLSLKEYARIADYAEIKDSPNP